MSGALLVEGHKAAASLVMRSASALVVVGILAIATAMSVAAAGGDPQVLAKLGPLAGRSGWDQLVGLVSMISAAAALLAFGVALSWIVGREFADDTIAGLFALPVTRRQIAMAKLAVFCGWTVVVAGMLTLGCLVLGVALGYGLPGERDAGALLRLFGLVVLTGLLALPAGWAATLGRGLLPGIAFTVALLAVGQVLTISGTGAWLPIAAPALWAVTPGEVTPWQLALVPLASLGFAALLARAWHHLELDR